MNVGLVLVSHSARLAEGLAELAAQMAPNVPLIAAGGRDDGGIGTSYDRVETAVQELLDAAHPVLILTDLGSATMTVDTLLDFLDDAPVRFVDAPFVEGAVAAAVAAQQGDSLDEVAAAAASVGTMYATDGEPPAAAATPHENTDATADAGSGDEASSGSGGTSEGEERYVREVTVVDPDGLHARPAARIAEMAADAEDEILLNGVDAASAMLVMALGVPAGARLTISTIPRDKGIGDRIADAIAAGLDD